jgi:hypothetical protein
MQLICTTEIEDRFFFKTVWQTFVMIHIRLKVPICLFEVPICLIGVPICLGTEMSHTGAEVSRCRRDKSALVFFWSSLGSGIILESFQPEFFKPPFLQVFTSWFSMVNFGVLYLGECQVPCIYLDDLKQ